MRAAALEFLAALFIIKLDISDGFGIFHDPEKFSPKSQVRAVSPSTNIDSSHGDHTLLRDRRQWMKSAMTAVCSAAIVSKPESSDAACLAGDVSPDCIGVYKLPLDDSVSKYIDTPEHLATNAPDLNWVPIPEYPKNYKCAKEELMQLQSKLKSITPLIQKGDLTSAGVEILAIAPRVTLTGRVIVQTLQNKQEFSMKAMRAENAHDELCSALGSCDIVIGQALNGRLGSITMAQIQILEDIRDADQGFRDLISSLPDGFEG